ncbi:hypothetical protein Scep_002693 [Stephania cephalantha]|uniref:Uncharacterized protein n=1 Tax=Stephania cephalantha TaxID=152367 RepID=A0AAP0LAC6_9MAGN
MFQSTRVQILLLLTKTLELLIQYFSLLDDDSTTSSANITLFFTWHLPEPSINQYKK